jgi:prolipoprotein diacylglyceryltransferase
MFPLINIWSTIDIYTFWVALVVSWALFFILLHHFSLQKWINKTVFSDIVTFTFSIFFFSRVFFIMSEWREEKFLFQDLAEWKGFWNFLHQFFITDNYNLSLAGGIIGFLLVFFIKTWHQKRDRTGYLDVVIFAFLLTAIVGYLWALLGGQIYGIPFNSPFSILYDNKNSIVPFQNPLVPLPILYMLVTGGIYWFLWKLSRKQELPNGFIGYMGMGLYSVTLFLWEFLNGSEDMFQSALGVNLNQLLALFLIVYAFIWFYRITKS